MFALRDAYAWVSTVTEQRYLRGHRATPPKLTEVLSQLPMAERAPDSTAFLDFTSPLNERPEVIAYRPDGTLLRTINRRTEGRRSETVLITPENSGDAYADGDKGFLLAGERPSTLPGSLPVRVADLFSGCGAMSLGIAEACRALGLGFEPVLTCDVNPVALQVYAGNFGVPVPPVRDLNDLSSLIDGPMTPFEIGLRRAVSEIDIVVAGPPCQGHSNLNNHTRRNDPKNALYFKVARFAKLFEPKFILIENVPAVLRDKGHVVLRTMRALEDLGYRVKHGVVDMWRLGVAQSRRRHVLIAFARSIPFRVPDIAEVVASYTVRQRNVRWAIEDLEIEKPGDFFDGPAQMKEHTRRRIDVLFETDRYELPNEHRPDCHQKEHTYTSVYGRMRWDGLAPTITTGFNSMGQGRFVHPSRRRTLTPHEAARLQFIPDFFDFRGVTHMNRLTELIGNAVPPKLSYVFGLEMMR